MARRLELKPDQWMLIPSAFAWVMNSVGSRDLAERDMNQDLAAGRLRAAARVIEQGQERRLRLPPSFWKGVALISVSFDDRPDARLTIQVRPRPRMRPLVGSWYIYVNRADLVRLYPGPPAQQEASASVRRRPGPKPAHEWPDEVARELIRLAEKGERLDNTDRLVRHMQDVLANKFDLLPEPKAIRAAILRFRPNR